MEKEELGIPVLSTSPYERCSVLPRVPEKETRLPVEKMYIGGSHLPSKNHPPPLPFGKERKKASSYFLFMFSPLSSLSSADQPPLNPHAIHLTMRIDNDWQLLTDTLTTDSQTVMLIEKIIK